MILKCIISFGLLLSGIVALAQKEHFLLIGTYTGGSSEGIYIYKFNSENAESRFISSVKTSNPSFLTVSADQKFVFAVNEDAGNSISADGGSVTSFSFDAKKGMLSKINSRESWGRHPCYIEIDSSGKWLFAANYSSGNLSLFPVNSTGMIGDMKQFVQNSGAGPDTLRQRSEHIHTTVLSRNQRYLFVTDLGTDELAVYPFNNKKGTLTVTDVFVAKSIPGSGPRHLAIDKENKYVYLLEELTGTVVVYQFAKGKLIFQQRISVLPAGFKGINTSADIHISPDGDHLYCSNRGESNNISIFRINKGNGQIELIGHQPTLGKIPRNFNFDPSGNFLLVANQQSGEIVIFKIDKQTGLLTDSNKRITVPSPVCIKWIQQ